MNQKDRLQARLKVLQSDMKDCYDVSVLARWPNLTSNELRRELGIRIEEVKRMLEEFPMSDNIIGGETVQGDAPEQPRDRVVEAVRVDLLRRSQLGIKKYGVTLERTDLSLKDWLQHAYEETLDQANYLKRAILEIENTNREG